MKTRIFFSITFLCLSANMLWAQSKKPVVPFEDEIAYANIYVQYGRNKPHNLNITHKNILQLFGKPSKSKREKSEISGAMYTEYTYPFGITYIEDTQVVSDIQFKAKGLTFLLKVNNKLSKPISVGDDATYLGVLFPKSRKMMKENILTVWIKNTDSDISFEISNGYITRMDFFTNES